MRDPVQDILQVPAFETYHVSVRGVCQRQFSLSISEVTSQYMYLRVISDKRPYCSLARSLPVHRPDYCTGLHIGQPEDILYRAYRTAVIQLGLLTSPSAEEEDFAYVRRLERNLLDHLPHVERQLSEEVERVAQLSDEGLHAGELW
ncbi:hypothetical protein H0G86_002896 [Trichoderma simmonsii]|uniref:Uncharacterized protein n=1 Tax=Trichoderma simmonsii TaxID=1491479 RepID=A0A8G0L9L5_9HYPO|nr:hypothetical protein H0G86_002896 [Trichoderma simmonsii]